MDIIEAAVKAGIDMSLWSMGAGSLAFVEGVHGIPRTEFERFAQIIRDQALEDAAKVCEEQIRGLSMFATSRECIANNASARDCAAAIRSMKKEQT